MESVTAGGVGSKTVNLALCNGCMTPKVKDMAVKMGFFEARKKKF